LNYGKLFLLLLAVILYGGLTVSRAAQKSKPEQTPRQSGGWGGNYSFGEVGDKNTGMVIEYSMRIYQSDRLLLADIDADGFQTQLRITCSSKMEGNRIHLYFKHYRETNLFEIYKPGEWLLSLERKRGKILTYWHALKPQLITYRNGRVYFQR
jgi:hypothetical protein